MGLGLHVCLLNEGWLGDFDLDLGRAWSLLNWRWLWLLLWLGRVVPVGIGVCPAVVVVVEHSWAKLGVDWWHLLAVVGVLGVLGCVAGAMLLLAVSTVIAALG